LSIASAEALDFRSTQPGGCAKDMRAIATHCPGEADLDRAGEGAAWRGACDARTASALRLALAPSFPVKAPRIAVDLTPAVSTTRRQQ